MMRDPQPKGIIMEPTSSTNKNLELVQNGGTVVVAAATFALAVLKIAKLLKGDAPDEPVAE